MSVKGDRKVVHEEMITVRKTVPVHDCEIYLQTNIYTKTLRGGTYGLRA